MTDSEAINNINEFTDSQKAEFNLDCNSKVHTINQGRITQTEIDVAQDTADHIDAMTQSNIDANISPSLNDSNKLSERPC